MNKNLLTKRNRKKKWMTDKILCLMHERRKMKNDEDIKKLKNR